MNFQKNMGIVDRLVRIVAAVLFGYLYFSGIVTGALGIILLVLGIIFILTSLVRTCPLYIPFKINTIKKEAKE